MKERQPQLIKSEPLYKQSRRDLTALALEKALPTKRIGFEQSATPVLESLTVNRKRKEATIIQSDTAVHIKNLTQDERDATARELRALRMKKKASERGAWASFIKNNVGKDGLNADGTISKEANNKLIVSGFYKSNPEMLEIAAKKHNRVSKESKLLKQRKEEQKAEPALYDKFVQDHVGIEGLNADGTIKTDVLSLLYGNGYFDQNPAIWRLIQKQNAQVPQNHPLLRQLRIDLRLELPTQPDTQKTNEAVVALESSVKELAKDTRRKETLARLQIAGVGALIIAAFLGERGVTPQNIQKTLFDGRRQIRVVEFNSLHITKLSDRVSGLLSQKQQETK